MIKKESAQTNEYEVRLNQYGFSWGNVLIERMAAQSAKRPKFQVLRVWAPNGEGVDVIMTPRKLRLQKFGKYKETKKNKP